MGFDRRLKGFLAGAAFLAALAPAPGSSGSSRLGSMPSPGPAWWEVRITVAAGGVYTVAGGPVPIFGEFACRLRWDGRLQSDDDDFLLIHLATELQEWRLRETAGPAGRRSVLESPPGARPKLHMDYILKDGRDVEFIFGLEGVPIPLHPSPLSVGLELPRSSGRTAGPPGQAYGDFVCKGSSRVAVPESDLQGAVPERRFSWDWRRERHFPREGRTYIVTQSHAVEVVVALTAH